MQMDVSKVVMQLFTQNWILPNFNVSTVVFLPETNESNSMENFRPIAMSNFKFKIITKIMDDRLASFMPHLIIWFLRRKNVY